MQTNVPDFTELPNWPPNSPDLNPMDYSIWGLCSSRYIVSQEIIDGAIEQWSKRLLLVVCSRGGPIKHLYVNSTSQRNLTLITLTFGSLSETFVRRSLFSSSSCSCHGSDVTWQEIGHMCGSVCSCPHLGSLNAIPPFGYVPPPWSNWCSC